MPITSEKIAKLAGVSRGTVDRALHNRGGVKPEVEQKIKEIAQRYGYKPDRAGKALSIRKNPPRLGVLMNSRGNPFFQEVKEGISAAQKELADFRLEILLTETQGYRVEDQLAALDAFLQQDVKGVIIMPVDDVRIGDKINAMTEMGIRFVTVNTDIAQTRRLAYVGSDYLKSGRTAAGLGELLVQGQIELLIVTGSVKNSGHNLRISGFAGEMENRKKPVRVVDIIEDNDDEQAAYASAKKKLAEHPEINMVYVVSAGAAGVAKAVAEQKRRIPVLCFDSTPKIASLVREGKITATICQDPFEQGYRSVLVLFNAVVNGILPTSEFFYTDSRIKIRQNID